MKWISMAAALACLGSSAVLEADEAAAKVVVSTNNGARQRYDCEGGAALVSGNENIVTLVNCRELTVAGNKNTIDAGEIASLTIPGSGNQVEWLKPRGGTRPKVTNTGEGNVLSQRRPVPTAPRPAASPTQPTVASPPTTPTGPELVAIMEDAQTGSQNCKGADAVVNSNKNTLTFQACGDITVNGDDNVLEISGARTILVSGNGNKVAWAPGSAGADPEVIDYGEGNTIEKKPQAPR